MGDNDVIDTNEAATLLGVSPSTVRRLVQRRHLAALNPVSPTLARAKVLLFRRADVQALVGKELPRKPRQPRPRPD
jgi:hypothetical protein